MGAIASNPVKVKCTLSDDKKIKVFISNLMIPAYCLHAQKFKTESEKLNKIRSLSLSWKWHTRQQFILIPEISLNRYINIYIFICVYIYMCVSHYTYRLT